MSGQASSYTSLTTTMTANGDNGIPHATSLPSILPSIDEQLDVANNHTAAPSKKATNANENLLPPRHHRRVVTDVAAAGRRGGGNIAKAMRLTSYSRVTTVPSPASSLHSNSTGSPQIMATKSTGAVGLPFGKTQLLQNMMRSHKNRNPYRCVVIICFKKSMLHNMIVVSFLVESHELLNVHLGTGA